MKIILTMAWTVWLGLGILVTVASCDDSEPLTPFQCRVTGVAVEDGDTVTGTIVEELYYADGLQSRAACFKPFQKDNFGCVIALNEGEYRVVYTSSSHFRRTPYVNARNHERCHAYYEEWKHL
jgi:hypothetical protein